MKMKLKKFKQNYFYKYGYNIIRINEKNIDPNEFLSFVHDIDISFMKEDKFLRDELD